ncbi:MAG: hypothetical protein WAJ85_01505 [Candidatus Baltobacteraceae bacterium]
MQHARPPRLVRSFAAAAVLALGVAFVPVAGVEVRAQQPPEAPPSTAPAESPTPEASETPGNAFLKNPNQAGEAGQTGQAAQAGQGQTSRKHQPKAKPTQGPEPTATPTSPAFATLDGTWEVQLQTYSATAYSYLAITQHENGVLSGSWKLGKTSYPFDGTYDGRLIKLVVKEPSGDVTFSGYVETASDMVGLVDFGAGKGSPVPFTAEHRGHPKGLRNIE